LSRYDEYTRKAHRLSDDALEAATQQLKELRTRVMTILVDRFQLVWGLTTEEVLAIEDILVKLEQDARIFVSSKEVIQKILAIVNMARQRKYPPRSKAAYPMINLDEFPAISEPLKSYIDKGFSWHERQALLRHDYRQDLRVYDDYITWKSLVQETMLGTLDEDQHRQATISSNVYIPGKYPTTLVLRHNKLWFEVPEDEVRRYLLGYLKRPQWQGKTWDEIKNSVLIPEDATAFKTFFAAEERQIQYIGQMLDGIKRIDREIDERVLDLYGIINTADRQRVLGSAPVEEDEEEANNDEQA